MERGKDPKKHVIRVERGDPFHWGSSSKGHTLVEITYICLLFSSARPSPWQSSSRSPPPPPLLLCTHCYHPPPAPLAVESFLLHLSCSSLLGYAGFSLPNLISFHANSLSLLPPRSNNNNNRRKLGKVFFSRASSASCIVSLFDSRSEIELCSCFVLFFSSPLQFFS